MKLFKVEYITKSAVGKTVEVEARSHIQASRIVSNFDDYSLPSDIEMLEWYGVFKRA